MGFGDWPAFDPGFTPLADVEETGDSYLVDIDLPGVSRDDINVELAGRRLVVDGERKEKERSGIVRRRTRRVGKFHYEILLPGEVDQENIEANIASGTLTVRVPKAVAERPRKITVK
jgi:HSP20 family protein